MTAAVPVSLLRAGNALAKILADGLPIGPGVTKAACKSLVKQRLCISGMRWKNNGARIVLSLRALFNTAGRRTPFRQQISQFGADRCY